MTVYIIRDAFTEGRIAATDAYTERANEVHVTSPDGTHHIYKRADYAFSEDEARTMLRTHVNLDLDTLRARLATLTEQAKQVSTLPVKKFTSPAATRAYKLTELL